MKSRILPATALLSSLLLAACGGGGDSSVTAGGTGGGSGAVLAPPGASLVRVTEASPYKPSCGGALGGSVSYENAEEEPYLAINPANPANLVAAWQQDRWSDGGAHGLVAGSSMDGGKTWAEHRLKLSRCGGGNSTNGGDYARASDPWVSFAPDGSAVYVISISFTGNTFAPGSTGSVLVSRSADGGVTWGDPVTLIQDGATAFNDKEAITADPTDPNFVYAVWDRLTTDNHGAAMFSRTTDAGTTWDTATAIYDPGVGNQTLGNEIVVLGDGTLLDLFEEIDNTSSNTNATSTIKVIRSTDHGTSWSTPITVARNFSVGTVDPTTRALLRVGAGLPQMAAGPGSTVAVVWQDGRFSNGSHDGIAYSSSADGGRHWSAPVQINSVTGVAAFTPSVAILADGTVGVTYFDLRNDTSAASLPTDYWFTSSSDGTHWSEQHITGPFDMTLAPDAEGLFLGDYQALGKIGSEFVPFFVQAHNSGISNRTDGYFLPQPNPLHATRQVSRIALSVPTPEPGAAFNRRVHENLMHLLRNENPGWEQIRAGRLPNQPP